MGNFHSVQSPSCPTNEEGECLQISCRRNPLRWHQPWLPIWGEPGRSFCWQLMPLLPLKVLLRSCHILQDDWPAGCAEVCCSHGEPLLLLAASLLESSLTRSRQPSANCRFWWLLIPGPSDLTCPTLLWIKQTLCPVDVAMQHMGKGVHSMVLCIGRCLGRSAPAWPHLPSAPAKGHTSSTSTETLKRWHRRSKLQLQKLWPRRNFRVNRLFQLPNLWLLNHKQQAVLQFQVPSAVFRDSLLRRSQPTSQDHTAASR